MEENKDEYMSSSGSNTTSGNNHNKVTSVYQRNAISLDTHQNDESIPDKIGTGDDAKNSVVWHVITYSLTIYACIVSALLVIDVVGNNGRSALTIVKDSWAIFTPIITLSLGYMFGKSEDAKKNQPQE